jgi:hypothetical protein
MQHYDYIEVYQDEENMIVKCTDPEELDYEISQLQQLYPQMKMTIDKLPSGSIYYYSARLMASRMKMVWWLVDQLCARGWEPLGAVPYVFGMSNQSIFHYQYKHFIDK